MDSFKKLLKYVWPQWQRVTVMLICVVLIAITFSASFLTVIPLLKVMMGQEGLHGWANRQICNHRFGVDFYVPDNTELTDPASSYSYYLLLDKAKDSKLGYESGLRKTDKILSVSDTPISDESPSLTSGQMLAKLAYLDKKQTVYIKYSRMNESGSDDFFTTTLTTKDYPFYMGMVKSLMRHVSTENTVASKSESMRVVMFLVAIMTVIRCTCRFIQGYLSQKMVNISLANLRKDVFAHLVEMPIGFFSREGSSDTVSKFLQDTNTAGNGLRIVFDKAIREPANGIACLIFAFALNWQIVLVFICGIPFLGFAIGKLGKSMKKATRKSLVNWGLMLGKLEESISGLRAVKVYNQQERECKSFATINDKLLREQNKIARVTALTSPLLEVLGLFAGIIGFLMALQWVLEGNMDETKFFALLMLLGTSAESFRKTSNLWNKLQESNAASERIFSVLDNELESRPEHPKQIGPITSGIEFKDIHFRYPGAKEDTLKGVALNVLKGQNIAIVGSNGSGKTTLLNLLPRFYDPYEGDILIDGISTREMCLDDLRRKIAIVSQNVITFSDTVANNIAYSKPNATREEIIEAAKHSFSHEFIEAMPQGYDTMIGENGAGLSGGQLQRIVIARAILKNPEILIFDEAMSQVDSESESKINKALEELTSHRTSFVIAHRFSTVINSDIIAVMENGKIVKTGKHAELLQTCQTYKNLYETQLLH